MRGHVYFLENPAMPGLLKIGFTTTSLEQRLGELNTTGVPEEFVVCAAFLVADAESCEKSVHALLSNYRVREQREFFRLPLKSALETCLPTLLANIDESSRPKDSVTTSQQLDSTDTVIMEFIVHSANPSPSASWIAKNNGLGREKTLLRLGELVVRGFLKERHDEFSLTHKGRKYAFDHGLVIPELLP